MAHELLDGGEVGAGVEEVAGVGAAQVVGGTKSEPATASNA